MPNQKQDELLSLLQSGDKAAFEQLFRLHFKPLRLNAYLILKNEQEAEDIVQQLFLDIWNFELYRNIQTSLKSYLHTAIKHRCLNYLKSQNRQTKKLHEYAIQLQTNISVESEPPSPQLLTVLDSLPAQQWKAFHLIHMQNKKYQEAAEEMGISINSLKSHLKLAVKCVRGKLKAAQLHPINE